MGHVLEPLLHDLAERFRFLEEELRRMTVPPEAEASRQQIHQLAARAKLSVEGVLADPDVSRPEFAKNFYHTFKRLSELAQAIDEGPLFSLSRFRDEDRFLTKVVAAVCRDFQFPDEPPICGAMSAQYYCAMTEMNLILVPQGEATHLLGWPDFYHELGHFIVLRNESAVLVPLMDLVAHHFAQGIDEARRTGRPEKAIEELKTFRDLWLGDWIVEFACDLVATFATGCSFAWENLRLCARMSTDVYAIVKSHPADAARAELIVEMVSLILDGKEKEFLEDRWSELVATVGAAEPQLFRAAFPKTLLRDLAKKTKECFEALGLKAYSAGQCPMADLLNDAWKYFQSHPESYADWERAQIGELRQKVGIND